MSLRYEASRNIWQTTFTQTASEGKLLVPRVVVPLDGSSLAEATLPWVQALSKRMPVDVVLCSVVEVSTDFAAWVTSDDVRRQRDMDQVLTERREYVEEVAARHGLESAAIDVRVGTPAREILACVLEATDHAPLIVMSTHGHGGFRRFALGSVALQIIHGHDGPIMTIRDDGSEVAPRFDRLLVPVDGSDYSAAAIDAALELLGEPSPQVHLLRVLGTPAWAARSINAGLVAEYLAASREWAEEQLDHLSESTSSAGYRVTTELRIQGNVIDEILDAADSAEADLIAMSTHGLGGIGRIVLGSVADGTLRRSSHPVLLVRPSTERSPVQQRHD